MKGTAAAKIGKAKIAGVCESFPVALETDAPYRSMFWVPKYDEMQPFAALDYLLLRATIEEAKPVRFWIDRRFRGFLDLACAGDPNVIVNMRDPSEPWRESYNGIPVEIVEG